MTTASILILLFFVVINARVCYNAYTEQNYFATSITAITAVYAAALIIYLITS